jgi:hypothetical protein
MGAQEVFNGAMGLLTDRFGLCPFMLNGVKVRGIGWKVFEGVARLAQEVLKISPFVEGGVIQDEHGIGRPLG